MKNVSSADYAIFGIKKIAHVVEAKFTEATFFSNGEMDAYGV
jgi:hypothetical protein